MTGIPVSRFPSASTVGDDPEASAGIVCRPTPSMRRIKGERANAPGARIYARAYSPDPRCLNRENAYVCNACASSGGRWENRRDVHPETNRGPKGPPQRTRLNGEMLASQRYVNHFGSGLLAGSLSVFPSFAAAATNMLDDYEYYTSWDIAYVPAALERALRKLLLSPDFTVAS